MAQEAANYESHVVRGHLPVRPTWRPGGAAKTYPNFGVLSERFRGPDTQSTTVIGA